MPGTTGEQNRRRWTLSQEAFDALLARLAPNREEAGERFEALRRRLLQFFSYEGLHFPDRWTDETLDRVAKRVSDGLPVEDVSAYMRGVARLVLREARTLELKEGRAVHPERQLSQAEVERDARCLDACLAELPAESRRLIEAYYGGDWETHITRRLELANELGLKREALRSRALRIRKQLEACLVRRRQAEAGVAEKKSGMVFTISPLKNRSAE